MEGAEGVCKRDAAAPLEDDAGVKVGPRIDVHGDDVAVPAAGGEDFRGEVHTGEAASEDEMVGIGLADGGAESGEVAFGDQPDKGALGRCRRGGGSASLSHEGLQCLAGAVFGREGEHEIEEASGGVAEAPPAQFVVDEVADEPGVAEVGRATLAGEFVAGLPEVGVEDVGEGGAGGVAVGGYPAVGVVAAAEVRGKVKRVGAVGVDERAVAHLRSGADGEEVEAP